MTLSKLEYLVGLGAIVVGGVGIFQEPTVGGVNPLAVGLVGAGVLVVARQPVAARLSDQTLSVLGVIDRAVRVSLGALLALFGTAYFLTDWAGSEPINVWLGEAGLSPWLFYTSMLLFGVLTLLAELLPEERDNEEPPQYGYDDKWERENL